MSAASASASATTTVRELDLDAAVTSATRRSRRFAPFALLGVAAIIASLVALYVQAQSNLREARVNLAEARQANAKLQRSRDVATANAIGNAETLETVRAAYAAGDMPKVETALGLAVVRAEKQAEAPQQIAVVPTGFTPAQARAIVDVTPTYTAPANAGRYSQQVYIQFAGVLTRAEITAFNRALRVAGWATQSESGERTRSAAGKNEVRYSGANGDAARALAQAVNAAGIVATTVAPSKNPIIRPNELEIWISR